MHLEEQGSAQAPAALRDGEALFRRFAEASTDVLWVRSAADLRLEYVSPAFAGVYGVDPARPTARSDLRGWAALIHPGDRRRILAGLRRVRGGERVVHEFRIQRPDGAERWVRDAGFPLTDDRGRVQRVAGIGQDVTEIKGVEAAAAESEAALRLAASRLTTLVEGVPQLVWRSAAQGRWTWASPQWIAFTGQSREGCLGLGWLDALHPDDRERAMAAWREAGATGRLDVEHRLRRASDGSHRWFATRAAIVGDAGPGATMEWLGTSTDVQNLKELQDRLGVLVAELQHRTRNLIGVVRAVADRTLAGSRSLEDFHGRFRDRMEALARVNGLLPRLHEGDRVTFDELIRAELTGHGLLDGRGRGAQVRLHGASGIRLRSATVQTLALALHELATNALRHGALSRPGGHLEVAWRLVDGGSGGERLQVDWTERGARADAGGGSPSEGGAAEPRRRGYGRELIEWALPYQLGAETTYELGPEGVRCRVTLPLSSGTERTDA